MPDVTVSWVTPFVLVATGTRFAILLLLVIAFTPALERDLQLIVTRCFLVPLLVQFVDPIVGTVFRRGADAWRSRGAQRCRTICSSW
jgi:hypothetical protein